jgi:hypothetical protein
VARGYPAAQASSPELANGIAVDAAVAAYVSGSTLAIEFPTATSAYSHTLPSSWIAHRSGDRPGASQQPCGHHAAGVFLRQRSNRIASVDFNNRDHATTFDGDNRAAQSTDSLYNQSGTTTITTTPGFDPDRNVVSQTMQTAGQTHTYTATCHWTA